MTMDLRDAVRDALKAWDEFRIDTGSPLLRERVEVAIESLRSALDAGDSTTMGQQECRCLICISDHEGPGKAAMLSGCTDWVDDGEYTFHINRSPCPVHSDAAIAALRDKVLEKAAKVSDDYGSDALEESEKIVKRGERELAEKYFAWNQACQSVAYLIRALKAGGSNG